MPKAVASVLELLGKVTELPFCLFVLSLVLLADTDSAIMGVAFSFESLSQVSLQHWIGFGVLVFLLFEGLYLGIIRDRAERRDSTIWLPGHELLELPVIPRPESARQAVVREGGPKPSRAAIASNGPAAFP